MSAPWASRFALVELQPGGLLLDLVTGTLFELNASAESSSGAAFSMIESPADVERALVDEFGIPLSQAQLDVETARSFTQKVAPSPPLTDFHYARRGDSFVLSLSGVPMLEVDAVGEYLTALGDRAPDVTRLQMCLHAIAPKVLALRGEVLLHASAISLEGKAIAFSGVSGAGKTTTARVLVRAGALPVCEDQLVVRADAQGAEVVADGERIVQSWEDAVSPILMVGKRASCAALDTVKTSRTIPLSEIGLVDVGRRRGQRIDARLLQPLNGASAIFRNGFYGSDGPEAWRRQLQASAQTSLHVRAYELDMPEGVALLDKATEHIISTGSLRR